MKKQIVQVMSILIMLVAFAVAAFAGVQGSLHDLTLGGAATSYKGDNDEICIYCHTPHTAVVKDRLNASGSPRLPLWNRSLKEYDSANGAFVMYDSSTYNGKASHPADGIPMGYSLMCLSCHDGISSLGAVINNSGGNPTITRISGVDKFNDLTFPAYDNVNIGRDLSNDHPVSFDYAAAVTADTTANGGTPQINNPPTNASLKLFGGRMECTTCHDPHEYGNLTGKAPFLRMSNAASGMCLACHIK